MTIPPITPNRILVLICLLMIVSYLPSKAQNISTYIFSQGTRTYSAITGGTIISSSTTHNNQTFNNQNIGFTFNYAGTDYTQLGVSINGYVTIGTGITNTTTPINSQNLTISAVGTDLVAQTGAVLRMETTGLAPNRVCVIQWAGYKYNNASDPSNYNFQIRLYETSNTIELHYGTFTHTNNQNRTVQIGLRGEAQTDFINRRLTSASNWSNTTAGTARDHSVILRNTSLPTSGLLLTYATPKANLGLSFSVDQSDPCVNSTLTYTATVTSAGPQNTTGVQVTSAIPSGLTFVSATPSQGTYNSGTGLWNIGNMNNGANVSLLIVVTVNSNQGGNNINSTASITASGLADPVATNNSASLIITPPNNALPTISAISNTTAGYNSTTGAIPFTIGDVETPVNNLIVSITSSNITCIPLSGIVLSGTGANRSMVITPGLNQFGNSNITIEVSDGVCSFSRTFDVTVFKQTFANFESARIVVGQTNFTSINTTSSQTIAPGSNSSAVSAKGVLAVGSQTQNRVLLWNSVPTANGTAANVVVGQNNFTATGTAITSSGLNAPDGVAFSPDGNKLIIADAGNDRVLIWNTIPTTNNKAADVVIGSTNFTTNNKGEAANRLSRPTDILVTPNGKLLITDRENNRVLIFNKIPTTNNASADLVIGQTNLTNDGAGNTASTLRTPWNCSLAPDGKLLIADDGNNRILVYNSIPTTNGASADLVIGQDNFTGNAGGSGANKFYYPGVTVSPSGVVAIADYSNHRVLVYNQIPTTNGANADIVLGQANFTQAFEFNNGSGNEGTASDKNMSQPYGINFDLNERLFVNGRNMHRLMVFGETPSQVADLALSFSGNDGTPCVGGFVSYTIAVTNNGPNNATNVVVTSALPYGFTPSQSNISSGTYNSASGYWTIPFIGNGETVTLEMIGSVNSGQNGASITTYASVRSYNQADNNFTNNSGSVTVTVETNVSPTITPIADIVTDFNTSTGDIDFTIADTETGSGSLIVTATSSNTTIVPNANIIIGGTGGNRTINITPALNQSGTVAITVLVYDGLCNTSLTFNVSCGNVWLGYTTDWTTVSNWSASDGVTTASAFIPTNPAGGNFPVANSNIVVTNLTISTGARITVNATRTITIEGNYINNGNTTTGNGTLVLAGSSAQTFAGLAGSVTVNNASGISLNGNTNIQGTLTLTSGNFAVGSNTLTLRNPIAGTLNSLVTNGNSSIVIEGSAAGIALPGTTTTLSNLTLNNASGLNLNTDLSIGNALTLSNGPLRLNGHDLVLSGTIGATTGTITATTASNITINGSGAAGTLTLTSGSNSVNNFTINRTGAGTLTLGSDVRVAGALNLIAGKITTGSNKMLVENTDPNSITNYGVSSYIHGNLKRCVVASETYDFPVGSTTQYELATITFNSISESTCMDAMFTEGMTGTVPTGLSEGGVAVDGILDYGFWTIKPDNPAAVINYNVTLTSRGHSNGGSTPEHHTIIKRDNSATPWILPGSYSSLSLDGTNSDPVTATRTNITGFSDMGVGVSSEGELPIELTFFKASTLGVNNLLLWQTASETENDYFELERGLSPETLEAIAKIQGMGTTFQSTNYSYEDKDSPAGLVYYRLKQVDFDGRYSYSNIIRVSSAINSNQINVYPNPISSGSYLSLEIPSIEEITVLIDLRDISGNVIQSWSLSSKELNVSPILIPKVAQGIYFVSLTTDKARIDKKIVVR